MIWSLASTQVQLMLRNMLNTPLYLVRVGETLLEDGMVLQLFSELAVRGTAGTLVNLYVDFGG